MAQPILRLRAALTLINRTQSQLARHLGVSTATVSLILNYDKWPKGHGGKARLRKQIEEYLSANGADEATVATAFDEAPSTPCANRACPMAAFAAISGPQQTTSESEDPFMLLRKHTLSSQARQHFRIARDPFTDEMETDADVFVSDDIRYVRAAMRQTARHGGMLAVVAESGGGKSTLVQDLQEWINTSREPITLITPYVLGMGRADRKSRPLLADDIIRSIFRALAPTMAVPQNAERRAAAIHQLLAESARIGRRHALVIEEAHDLATPTLKHLKRFYELQDGFRKLLAIMLIGQTELEGRLSEHDASVREVVQRCEIVHLPPLDNHVEAYLRHKLARVDLSFDALFEPDAADEIRSRLRTATTEGRGAQRQVVTVSLCHPLAINNLVSAALNEAVKIGATKVNKDLIAAAARASA